MTALLNYTNDDLLICSHEIPVTFLKVACQRALSVTLLNFLKVVLVLLLFLLAHTCS